MEQRLQGGQVERRSHMTSWVVHLPPVTSFITPHIVTAHDRHTSTFPFMHTLLLSSAALPSAALSSAALSSAALSSAALSSAALTHHPALAVSAATVTVTRTSRRRVLMHRLPRQRQGGRPAGKRASACRMPEGLKGRACELCIVRQQQVVEDPSGCRRGKLAAGEVGLGWGVQGGQCPVGGSGGSGLVRPAWCVLPPTHILSSTASLELRSHRSDAATTFSRQRSADSSGLHGG